MDELTPLSLVTAPIAPALCGKIMDDPLVDVVRLRHCGDVVGARHDGAHRCV